MSSSDPTRSEYLMAVQAGCYRVDGDTFATESAFAEHVRLLKRKLAPHFDRIYLAAPQYTDDYYEENKKHLGHIRERDENIFYVPLDRVGVSAWQFWSRDAPRIWRSLRDLTRRSRVLHGGLAWDIWRPSMFFAQLAAKLDGCKTLFFVDIDFRKDAWRFWKTGVWSFRTFATASLVYDPLRVAQVKLATKNCSLVMLKSAEMVEDFGRGAPHVRNYWDSAHSADQVIDDSALTQKLARLEDPERPIALVYFGRFVAYKGLDRAIRAVDRARRLSGRNFVLDLIGTGEEKPRLEALVRELGAEDAVRFHPPVQYGPELFARIRESDLLLANPLTEDTPRNAFDAMAAGVPILAFDIAYYRYLQSESQAVDVSPWPEVEPFAEHIVALDRDRPRLARMSRAGVAFARANTQEIWLDRRIQWTLDLLEARPA